MKTKTALTVPLRWKEGDNGDENYYGAIRELQEARSALVVAYDAFIATCQRNGMSISACRSKCRAAVIWVGCRAWLPPRWAYLGPRPGPSVVR